jgi:TrpR family trp operon transcriptional repressor
MSDFSEFIELVYSTKDHVLLEDFLIGITTPKERREFSQRLNIVKKLIDGEAQKKIAEELGVGVATVTRGSKELSQGRFKLIKQGRSL